MALTLHDFSYTLPEKYIAQEPSNPRDKCRLMVVNRKRETYSHHIFRDLSNFLGEGDVLVLNQTKVFPARLTGSKKTGGKVELLLLTHNQSNRYDALPKPGLKAGQQIFFAGGISATVTNVYHTGEVSVEFTIEGNELLNFITTYGETPIPPYIKKVLPEQRLRTAYQTVYAKDTGSAAAPTAGMHFTQTLLDELTQKGVIIETITLHVGLGTFQRLRQESVADNQLHHETYHIDSSTAARLLKAKQGGKRIIAVGTTSTRALESAAQRYEGTLLLKSGWQQTAHFIYPPYRFSFIDGLITNFHLPESPLLMMVAAFTSAPATPYPYTKFSHSLIGKAYDAALLEHYHFFSFGDAMLIV